MLETDERVVSDMIADARPELLVLLNFSRDQLDRHHEIKALGRSWRVALERAGPAGPTIIANACDPLVVWSAGTAANVTWVETATTWNADGALCPACGTVLHRTTSGGRGRWDCPGCELHQPDATYRVERVGVLDEPPPAVLDQVGSPAAAPHQKLYDAFRPTVRGLM